MPVEDKKRRRRKIFIGLGVVLILVVFIVANLTRGKGGKVKVQVEEVKRGTVTHVVSASGKVQPVVQVKISANVAARVENLHVREGDRVRKGQILVELDRTRYEAAVTQAKANLSSAEANARLAKANLDKAAAEYRRTKELYEKGLTSQGQLETAQTTYEVHKAQYEAALDRVHQAKALLEQALDDLSKTTLRSPIDGVVIKVNKEVGEIALGSQFQEDVILIVADLSRMEVVCEIDESDVVDVEIGDTARIKIDAIPDTSFRGVVTEIAHTATTRGFGTQEEVTNFDVRVGILDHIEKLRPGMSAVVDIETETKRDVLRVPIQAVTVRDRREVRKTLSKEQGTKKATDNQEEKELEEEEREEMQEVVFVVEEGVAKLRPVKTGITSDTHIEIIDGLKEGEKVVVGSYRAISKQLRHGKPVKIEKRKGLRKREEK